MDKLILEVQTDGLNQYFPIEKAVTCIGRSLTNDIILSDPTIAPEHLRIELGEDRSISVINLTDINPIIITDRNSIHPFLVTPPVSLSIGRINARILDTLHSVEATRPIAGRNQKNHIFSNNFWIIGLVLSCLILGMMVFYLGSYSSFKTPDLIKYLLRETVFSLSMIIVVLIFLERMLVNRWEIKPVIVCVCLAFLAFHLSGALIQEVDYWFSSSLPGNITYFGWYILILPLAIASYLVKISHLRTGKSILLAILIASPISGPAVVQGLTSNLWLSGFSNTARYQRSLSPYHWHLSETRSIESFIKEAEKLKPGDFVD
ncbi:MAG: hypothetical protein ACI845_003787 [Gammaproteobacteria bacterium]|jgi:hypothetical protein